MRAKQWIVIWALTAASAATLAAEPYRAYSGPPLPRKEIAVCECALSFRESNGVLFGLFSIDGHSVNGQNWDGSKTKRTSAFSIPFSEVELLPGPHTLLFHYKTNLLQPSKDQVFSVVLDAGRTYQIRKRTKDISQSQSLEALSTNIYKLTFKTVYSEWFEFIEK